jgi:hypothetical protein
VTQARRAESSDCCLVILSWRGCQVSPWAEERKTERKSKREREREGECHLNGFPRVGVPGLGYLPTENAHQLTRHPRAKQWVPQVGVEGLPGSAPMTSETRERESRQPQGQVESSGRERLMMDGK